MKTTKVHTNFTNILEKLANSVAMGIFIIHVYLVNRSLLDAIISFGIVFAVEVISMAIFLMHKLGGSDGFLSIKDSTPDNEFKSIVVGYIEDFAVLERRISTVAALIGTLIINRVYDVSMFTEVI